MNPRAEKIHFCYHAVKVPVVFFKFIKGEIIMNDQENNQGCADTDGKSEHIDQRKNFIPEEVPVSDGDVGFEHRFFG